MKRISINGNHIIEWSLYGLVFALPFSKAAVQYFAWFAIIAWVTNRIRYRTKDRACAFTLGRSTKQYFLFFLVVCLLSVITSLVPFDSLRALITKIGKQVLLFYVIANVATDSRVCRNILRALIASAALIVSDALIQFFFGVDVLRHYARPGYRLQASFSNPIAFGAWLLVIFPIVACMLLFSRKHYTGKTAKGVLIFIGLGSLFGILMTYSRACWLALLVEIVCLVGYLLKTAPQSRRKKTLLRVSIFCVVIALCFGVPQLARERVRSVTHFGGSILIRSQLWRESVCIIQDFPLFGTGLNTYCQIEPYYSESKKYLYYPHNSYLHLSAETGLLGLFSFLLFIGSLLRGGLHAFLRSRDPIIFGLLLAIAAFLIHSFFDVNLFSLQLATLFWYALGLLSAKTASAIHSSSTARAIDA